MKRIPGITKRGNVWQVRKTYKGQQIYRLFSTGSQAGHTLAERYLQGEMNRIDQGQYVEVHKTLEEVFEHMEKRKRQKRKQSRITTNNLFEHVIKTLDGDSYIDSFTEQDIEDLEDDILSSGLKPRTQRDIISLVKRIFKHAMKYKWIKEDPTTKLERPKIEVSKVEVFTDSQMKRLFTEAERKFDTNPNLLGMLALGYYGCLRCGEMMGLQWKDIDWKKHIIHVDRQYHVTMKVFTDPKTDSSKNYICMLPDFENIMKRIYNRVNGLARFKESNCILTSYHEGYTGRPTSRNTLRVGLVGLTRRCDLPIETRLHTLRRSGVTMYIKTEGIEFASAQARHKDIHVTWQYYTSKDSVKDDALSKAWQRAEKKGA
ncbi:MAG: tyrosine-type recombinase/integrase [Succiniclasticum sp.]|uniref:tyrosine-type recombinase/integrase n=1 Tax=Succiniclasticum sp. TaxID=2775030 RepID=UPI002A917F47|nr:tyrosine-type recombinase/integrase [Succiniclasticum sp.]MDY6290080.1 tyrosine-type recombinase/integrase [Succiniclasticum sp.]